MTDKCEAEWGLVTVTCDCVTDIGWWWKFIPALAISKRKHIKNTQTKLAKNTDLGISIGL